MSGGHCSLRISRGLKQAKTWSLIYEWRPSPIKAKWELKRANIHSSKYQRRPSPIEAKQEIEQAKITSLIYEWRPSSIKANWSLERATIHSSKYEWRLSPIEVKQELEWVQHPPLKLEVATTTKEGALSMLHRELRFPSRRGLKLQHGWPNFDCLKGSHLKRRFGKCSWRSFCKVCLEDNPKRLKCFGATLKQHQDHFRGESKCPYEVPKTILQGPLMGHQEVL